MKTHTALLAPKLLKLALTGERELAAFLSSVTMLYGADQAGRSAEDWLLEFELLPSPRCDVNWRAVTIAASARLARRLSAQSSRSEVALVQSADTSVSPIPLSDCAAIVRQV